MRVCSGANHECDAGAGQIRLAIKYAGVHGRSGQFTVHHNAREFRRVTARPTARGARSISAGCHHRRRQAAMPDVPAASCLVVSAVVRVPARLPGTAASSCPSAERSARPARRGARSRNVPAPRQRSAPAPDRNGADRDSDWRGMPERIRAPGGVPGSGGEPGAERSLAAAAGIRAFRSGSGTRNPDRETGHPQCAEPPDRPQALAAACVRDTGLGHDYHPSGGKR